MTNIKIKHTIYIAQIIVINTAKANYKRWKDDIKGKVNVTLMNECK